MSTLPNLILLPSPDWKDYALLDSGNGQRLRALRRLKFFSDQNQKPSGAQFFPHRPGREPTPVSSHRQRKTGGIGNVFVPEPDRWQMEYKGLRFWVQLGASRHTGLFPEQAAQWDWTVETNPVLPASAQCA